MQTLLIGSIVVGGLLGYFGSFTKIFKRDQDSIPMTLDFVHKIDAVLLGYLFPMLLFLMGAKVKIVPEAATVTVIMAVSMVISLAIGIVISKKVLKLDQLMGHGFLILAVCSNTGHGLMLLASSTTSDTILSLSMGPMYIGFIVVIFLPQALVNKEVDLRGRIFTMLFHPISYGAYLGVALTFSPFLAYGFGSLILARSIWHTIKKTEGAQQTNIKIVVIIMVLITMEVIGANNVIYLQSKIFFPLVMTFVTAATVGLKFPKPLEAGQWRIVLWILSFGLIIAPAIGLGLATVLNLSHDEAYVLAYMLSQPPAYLGMVWLRQGKFGKDFSISEKAFAIQALMAYFLAAIIPTAIEWFF